MMKPFKKSIKKNEASHKTNYFMLKELEWAHIYHDSIRGRDWLEKLPLNVGRWAGNYTFFYVLNRILFDYKPMRIVEFGLGESSKFISTFLEHHLKQSSHLIIEQSTEWAHSFEQNFKLSDRSEIAIHDMIEKEVNGFKTNAYKDIEKSVNKKHDLYIVDGPFGSDSYSRYDICHLAKDFESTDEFIIIIDDYHRKGEKETARGLRAIFKEKRIEIHQKAYRGNKGLLVLATEHYKYTTSL